jgi:hypothetical protein
LPKQSKSVGLRKRRLPSKGFEQAARTGSWESASTSGLPTIQVLVDHWRIGMDLTVW